MSDTPETDAAEFPCMTWPPQDYPMVVRSKVAKKLERERDKARAQRDRLAEEVAQLKSQLIKVPEEMEARRMREHACAMNRDMMGTCFVCGSSSLPNP
jgi:uncharacterized protein YlxW (UPF0749 family)